MIIIIIISLIGVQAMQSMEIENLRKQIKSIPTSETFDASGILNEISNIKIKQNNINSKIDSINYNISEIKDELVSSMKWFTTNSKVENSRVENNLSKCASGCTVNMNCIAEVNEDLGFEYRNDTVKTEYLKSINDFIKDGFGDCEDYALLFKAEYNNLVNEMGQCNEILSTDDYSGNDFITDGKMYLVCAQNEDDAHCLNYIVGIESGKKYFIEPQWGMYDPDFEETYPTSIFIITDNDFKIFNFDTNNWYSYGGLLEGILNE